MDAACTLAIAATITRAFATHTAAVVVVDYAATVAHRFAAPAACSESRS
jgi:hypothetical protein